MGPYSLKRVAISSLVKLFLSTGREPNLHLWMIMNSRRLMLTLNQLTLTLIEFEKAHANSNR